MASRQVAGFLVVLTGTQRGARAPLNESVDYVVGADEDCDLVIWDDSVAPRHLRLVGHAGRWRIEALDRTVVLDGLVLAAGESIECTPGLVLRLGEVCLGLGAEHQDWSQAVWPEPPADITPTVAKTDESVDAETPRVPTVTGAPETKEPAIAAPEPDDRFTNRQSPPRVFWIPAVAILGALLILALMLNGWWSASGQGLEEAADDPAATARLDPRTQARAVLERFSLTEAELTERPDGVLILTGYCDSRAFKERLTQALAEAGVRVDNRLWPEDRVREALAHALERVGAGQIEHDYLGRGVVRLSGHLPADLAKDQFLRLLYQDVAGLARVDDNVRAITDLIADLQQRVREAGLPLDRLEFSAEGQAVRVAGRLNAADAPRWEAVANAFGQAHPDMAPLDVAIKWAAARSGSERTTAVSTNPPVWVSSRRVLGILIGVDQTAFALLDDGTRVTKGDLIDGRYVVKEIQFDRVIAFDGSERKTFHVGASKND
jgi:type III secretion protein D